MYNISVHYYPTITFKYIDRTQYTMEKSNQSGKKREVTDSMLEKYSYFHFSTWNDTGYHNQYTFIRNHDKWAMRVKNGKPANQDISSTAIKNFINSKLNMGDSKKLTYQLSVGDVLSRIKDGWSINIAYNILGKEGKKRKRSKFHHY